MNEYEYELITTKEPYKDERYIQYSSEIILKNYNIKIKKIYKKALDNSKYESYIRYQLPPGEGLYIFDIQQAYENTTMQSKPSKIETFDKDYETDINDYEIEYRDKLGNTIMIESMIQQTLVSIGVVGKAQNLEQNYPTYDSIVASIVGELNQKKTKGRAR